MEEQNYKNMYEEMFANFQEQVRMFMFLVVDAQNGKESISDEFFDTYKKNLVDMLNILAKSIDNIKDENLKNFYKPKTEYFYSYIEELSSVYKAQHKASK